MSKEIFGSKQKIYLTNLLQPTIFKMIIVGLLAIWALFFMFSGFFGQNKLNLQEPGVNYVVKKSEIIILQRIDKFVVHTFGDTLNFKTYDKIISFPSSITYKFIIPDSEKLIEF